MISVLPDHIANQIAAGEVIQRPASVVKELVENAIDADATNIDIHVKDAGRTLIQVIDNGRGMSSLDAQKCFLRHATSKLKTADDLFALTTKGFRGEALASIAAIAHVSMQTCEHQSKIGTKILIEGSKIVLKEETVCVQGTNFEVKNLFYNVPARRNFLKSNEVEFRHIKDEFERIALAHPSISFSLTHNQTTVYQLHATVLRRRITHIIGDRQDDRLVPINEQTDIVKISGYVLKPEHAKKVRGEQFLFVNKRFFKDAYFHHAINKAFDGLVQPKTFPGYFLYFDVDPAKIDVNVHPTKTEIKFEENQYIYAILISSIRRSLGQYHIAPSIDFDREQSFDLPLNMQTRPIVPPEIKVNSHYNPFTKEDKTTRTFPKSINQEDWESFYRINLVDIPVTQQNMLNLDEQNTENWTEPQLDQFLVHSPYLFFTTNKGLMIIHGQRAYERIVYDSMMREFIIRPIASQMLLFPYERELSVAEQSLWQENHVLLERLGFFSDIKNNFLLLNSVPSVLQEEVIAYCLDTILANLSVTQLDKSDIAHVLVADIARNAGKVKQIPNNKESVGYLVGQLFNSNEQLYTPSGKLIIKILPFSTTQPLF